MTKDALLKEAVSLLKVLTHILYDNNNHSAVNSCNALIARITAALSAPSPSSIELAEEMYDIFCNAFAYAEDNQKDVKEDVKARCAALIDQCRTVPDKFAFSRLVEAAKQYIESYGPGYSTTDKTAYDNLKGILAEIASGGYTVEKE